MSSGFQSDAFQTAGFQIDSISGIDAKISWVSFEFPTPIVVGTISIKIYKNNVWNVIPAKIYRNGIWNTISAKPTI